VRLVGEAGRGRGGGRRDARGEQPARRPDPELALVVARRHPVGGAERPVRRIPAASGRRGQVRQRQVRARNRRAVVVDAPPDPRGDLSRHGTAAACPRAACLTAARPARTVAVQEGGRLDEPLRAHQFGGAAGQRRVHPQHRAGEPRVVDYRLAEQRQRRRAIENAREVPGPDVDHPVGEPVLVARVPVVRIVGVEGHDQAGTAHVPAAAAGEGLGAGLGDAERVTLVTVPVVHVLREVRVHRLHRGGLRAPVPCPIAHESHYPARGGSIRSGYRSSVQYRVAGAAASCGNAFRD
jgi:hypothetical protein